MMVIATSHVTFSFFHRQVAYLASHGFEVHAVSSPGPCLSQLAEIDGVKTHALSIARRPDVARDVLSLVLLWALILWVRPRLVHAHTPKAGLIGMLAALLAGVGLRLYTIHGLPLMTRAGWSRRILSLAERLSCAVATRVYSVSPSLEKLVRDLGLCRSSKLTTLGSGSCAGIDLERFNPEEVNAARRQAVRKEAGVPDNALALCFVGRVAKDKGLEVLAGAWERLAQQYPQLHLMVCGPHDITDPVPAEVLERLNGLPRVYWSGDWVKDVPAVYAASDMCVLPTYREGLSQVALESQAMGVPVVASRTTGLVNAVKDGVTGLLVPPADGEAFAKAISMLIEDPALRRRLGASGRRHVRENFAEERVNALFLGEYRDLTGDRTADTRKVRPNES